MAEAKTRLGKILQQEYQSKGIVGGAISALGKRSLEKLDIRNSLFGGSGLGSIIGQKIFGKGYSATRKSGDTSNVSAITNLSQNLNSVVLEEININSRISAKNSVVLPSMARDMNLMRMNIIKLVKLQGGTPSTRADMFFSRAKDRESMYERQFGRKSPTNVSEKNKSDDKKGLSFFEILKSTLAAITTIVKGVWSAITFVVDKITDLIGGIANLIMEMRILRGLQALGNTGIPDVETPDKKGDKTGKGKGKMPSWSRKMGKGILGTTAVTGYALATGSDVSVTPEDVEFPGLGIITKHFTDMFNSTSKSPSKVNKFAGQGESISQAEALKYFTDRGLTPEQAAGIVGNLMQESRLKSDAWNEKERAFGIAQWRNERLDGLKMFAAARGKDISDIQTQMDYILHELKTTESTAGQKLMQSSSASEAAFNFGKYYERPKVVEHTRIAYAEQALESFKKVTPSYESSTRLAGTSLNQTSFDNQMAKSLGPGETVVNNVSNVTNNTSGGNSTSLTTADVMDTELGRLLMTRMY